MRTILSIMIAATIALGAGCTAFAPAQLPVSQELPAAAQTAQKAINEANVALAAAANVLTQQVTDGILTKTESQSYLNRLKGYAKQVDESKALLDKGLVLDAQKEAELVAKLIAALHREVAARARKPS